MARNKRSEVEYAVRTYQELAGQFEQLVTAFAEESAKMPDGIAEVRRTRRGLMMRFLGKRLLLTFDARVATYGESRGRVEL